MNEGAPDSKHKAPLEGGSSPEKSLETLGGHEPKHSSERSPEEIDRERVEIEAKIETELARVNENRAKLNLPPLHTSASVDWHRRELAKLPSREHTPLPMPLQSDSYFENTPNITPEIRYYFTEVLGHDEMVNRLGKMNPETRDKVRKMITTGNLHELIYRFTLLDPVLKDAAAAMDKDADPTVYPRPSFGLIQQRMFKDLERSTAMQEIANPENRRDMKTAESLSTEEQAVREKIAQIPDTYPRLKKALFSLKPETRRSVLVSDELLLNGTEEDYARWEKYF